MTRGGQSYQGRPAPLRLLLCAILVLPMVAGGVMGSAACKSSAEAPQSLEVYGPLPDFQFMRQDGARFGREDMVGKVSIANFIFTRCPTVCPVFTMKMKRVAEQTNNEIQLVSISVDPEYDTPERLRAYAAKHGADTSRWHFLTGDHEAVKSTVEGALKIAMERQGEDENGVPDIVHGTHFVLFDSQGQIRGYYNSDDAERIATLIADAESLSK